MKLQQLLRDWRDNKLTPLTGLDIGLAQMLQGLQASTDERHLWLAALALVCIALGLVLLCGTVLLLFWEGYRLAACAGLAVVFLGGGALLLAQARQGLRQHLRPPADDRPCCRVGNLRA